VTARLVELAARHAGGAGLLLVQVTLALAAALLFDAWARRRRWPARVRQAAWLVALARMLWLLPFRGVPVPAPARWAPVPGAVPADAASGVTAGATAASAAPGAGALLLLAWAGSAALLLVLLGARLLLAHRRILRGTREPSPGVLAAAAAEARRAGLRRVPRVLLVRRNAGLPAPAVLGILRPVVLLPEAAGAWPAAILGPVLLHEFVHVRRRDPLVVLLAAVARCAWFFHPLAWLAAARLAETRELLCDGEVLRRLGDGNRYLEALVRVAEETTARRRAVAFAGMAETARGLRGRIETMRRHGADGRWGRAALAAALVLAVAIPLVAGVLGPARAEGSGTGSACENPQIPGTNGVTAPELVPGSRVPPTYPEKAREEGVEGKAILQVVICGDGTVSDLRVLRETPAGYGFGRAAVEAVRRWRYRPATRNGEPVAVYFTVVVNFGKDD